MLYELTCRLIKDAGKIFDEQGGAGGREEGVGGRCGKRRGGRGIKEQMRKFEEGERRWRKT